MRTVQTVCLEMEAVSRQMTTTAISMRRCHRRNLGRLADRYQQLLQDYNRLLHEYDALIN